MPTLFKPTLACEADLDRLIFPTLASPKLDGIRAIVRDGVVYSRSNKPIPNAYVQTLLARYTHFDGELIVGEPTSKSCYRDTVSYVMAHDKRDFDLHFYVFDHVQHLTIDYESRARFIKPGGIVVKHEQVVVSNLEALLVYEEACLEAGYEGLILRHPKAPYKTGRSTVKEGYLLKLKRFLDAEAVVIGFEERMENTNEKVTNELGRGQRSSHKAGKVGRGDLGALLLRTAQGVEFACGTGFSDDERASVWSDREKLLGQLVKYKYFPVGVKDAPRHPVFLGWRDRHDL